MTLIDPDLPLGIELPELSPDPPLGLNSDRYRWLREAFYELPRRSRVVVALRLPPAGHPPLTFRAIGLRLGLGSERIRQLEQHAVWRLSHAWHPNGTKGLSGQERAVELAPIIGAALDRYPVPDDDPDDDELARQHVARGPRNTPASTFGVRLAHERQRQCKSMGELARLAGCWPSEVSRLERGLRDPRLSTITRLAQALDVPVGELLSGPRADERESRPLGSPLGSRSSRRSASSSSSSTDDLQDRRPSG